MVSGCLRSFRGYLALVSRVAIGNYCRQHWKVIALWLLIILPLAPLVIGSVVILIYMFWPISYDQIPAQISVKPDQPVTILAHGLGASPAQWSDSLKQVIAQQHPQQQVISLDWSAYSTSSFRCSIDGKRIGNLIAQQLETKNIPSIQLVGHSCGSFVILGICEGMRKGDRSIEINATYLDPVSIYGGLWWNYGVNHFGQCANFSDAYIDTRDNVPGSNQALAHAYTFDVTHLSDKAGYKGNPHQWPIHFYQRSVAANKTMSEYQRQQIATHYQKNVLYQKLPESYNEIDSP